MDFKNLKKNIRKREVSRLLPIFVGDETSAITPRVSYHYGAMNFHGRIGN
jgi:hypothetical protein